MANNAVVLDHFHLTSDGYPILDNLCVEIQEGVCTAVMGLSGSGKSTFLKAAAGILTPDRGSVTIKGIRVNSFKVLSKVQAKYGFVFQDAALWSNTNVYDNIALPLYALNSKISAAEVKERVMAVVKRLDYKEALQLRPAQLSYGERKVVSFMRAIVNDPDLLYLDTPLLATDHHAAERMLEIIKEYKNEGRTIIANFAHPGTVSLLADRMVILSKGNILKEGSFNDIVQSQDTEIRDILSMVLNQPATYDESILDLLGTEGEQALAPAEPNPDEEGFNAL